MKLQTRDLKLFLSIAQTIGLNKRVTMPILQSALIDCKEGITSLTVSNLQQTCTIHGVKSSQNELISSTIPLEALKIAAKTKDTTIELIQTDSHKFTVSGQSCFGISSNEYPCLDVLTSTVACTEHISPSLADLDCVLIAASTDESRFNLCGVAYDHNNKALVATDGHRLHLSNGLNAVKESVIFPSVFIKGLIKIGNVFKLSGVDIGLEFSHTPSLAVFKSLSIEFTTRFIDGQFPDYSRIMPKTKERDLYFSEPSTLVDILSTLCDWHTDKIHYTTTLSTHNGYLNISAQCAEKGEFHKQLPCAGNIDKPINLNARYLKDTLSTLGNQIEVSFDPKHKLGPILLTSENRKAVIMPMKD